MGMANLQRMAQQMQQGMARVQAELATTIVDGSAGGGVVKAQVTGSQELVGVTIDQKRVRSRRTQTSRLDAALNYTPVKYLTLSLEGTNLLGEDTQRFFGVNRYMPVGPRLEAKTIQLGARFRF